MVIFVHLFCPNTLWTTTALFTSRNESLVPLNQIRLESQFQNSQTYSENFDSFPLEPPLVLKSDRVAPAVGF